MEIRVDTTELGRLSRALIQFRRSAFPSVTRSTLNDLAFETKKNVNKLSYNQFTIRERPRQNIFNTGILVEKAKYDRIETMKSSVGLNGQSRWGNLSKSVSKQELGGTIDKKSMIPLNTVRVSRSNKKKITKKKNLSKLNFSRGNSGGYFKFNAKNGKQYIAEPAGKGKRRKLKLLYTFKKGRSIRIKPKPFLIPSAVKASRKTEYFFRKNAKRVIERSTR
mgnify:CR=1 FL=1